MCQDTYILQATTWWKSGLGCEWQTPPSLDHRWQWSQDHEWMSLHCKQHNNTINNTINTMGKYKGSVKNEQEQPVSLAVFTAAASWFPQQPALSTLVVVTTLMVCWNMPALVVWFNWGELVRKLCSNHCTNRMFQPWGPSSAVRLLEGHRDQNILFIQWSLRD